MKTCKDVLGICGNEKRKRTNQCHHAFLELLEERKPLNQPNVFFPTEKSDRLLNESSTEEVKATERKQNQPQKPNKQTKHRKSRTNHLRNPGTKNHHLGAVIEKREPEPT